MDTTLPMPTPIAGVPDEYADRTLLCDPVTTNMSASCIKRRFFPLTGAWNHLNKVVVKPDTVKFGINIISSFSSGAAFGDGAKMIELPVFNEFTTLFTGVAKGLVDGTIAATTPFGRRNSLTPVVGLSWTRP